MLKPAITVKRSVAGFSILLGVYLLYAVVRLVMLANAGNAVLDGANVLQSSKTTQNISSLSASLDALGSEIDSANAIANDPLLTPVKWLPVFGKDFDAIGQLTNVSHDLVTAAEPVLASAAVLGDDSNGKSFNAFKADALANLSSRSGELLEACEQAEARISNLSQQNLDFGISQKLVPFKELLHQSTVGLRALQPLAATLGPVLSQQNAQTYFIATQNLAEARATGGILGSFAVITVNKGKIKLEAAGSDQDLSAFSKVNYSALPEAVRALWGVDNSDWRDMNASLHLPYFGEQIAKSFAKIKKIDGALFIGQGTVALLVAATGPMKVDGVEIDSSNVADFLAKGIYARYSSVQQKNAWVVSFMHTLFSRLEKQTIDAKALWAAAVSNQSGDRAAAWSANPKVQKQFELGQVAGEISQGIGSTTYFSVNNAGGNKLDAYLTQRASYALQDCGQTTDFGFAGRSAEFKLSLTNAAPKKGLPAYVTPRLDSLPGQHHAVGSSRELVSIYAPVGATFTEFTLDGDLINATEGEDRQHPVWVFDISLAPGQTSELIAKWVEPITDKNGRELQTAPTLQAPVSFNPIEISTKSSGYCVVN